MLSLDCFNEAGLNTQPVSDEQLQEHAFASLHWHAIHALWSDFRVGCVFRTCVLPEGLAE